jgi:hypothetical protein
MKIRTVMGAASLVGMLAGTAQATVLFSDSQFETTTWVTETIIAGGTFNATQSIGTGNGGPARHLDITTGANVGDTVAIFSRYGNTTATRYEPMLSGAISSIDLQMDVKLFATTLAGVGPEIYLGIKQGNVVFRSAAGFAVTPSVWTEILHIGYTASDFVRVDGGAGSLDFSGTAVPIRFGFVSTQANAGEAFTTASEYDNFCVYVQNVPSPGAAGLAGVVGVLAARRRRR